MLLLQYAIDPRLTNDKGLKAIDLAVKNKHVKCKDLLAEYHLHFVASSNFDSVLFFTALEGHRQAKGNSATFKAENDNESYTIMRKPSSSQLPLSRKSSATPNAMTLQKAKSFFSLKSDAPLRLESWGQWISFQDEVNGKIFWYNQEKHIGSETEPAEVTQLKQLPTNASFPGGMSTDILVKKKSMRLKKNGDWIQYITPDSNSTFFYNERTREFQWTDPNSNSSISRNASRQQLRAAASAIALMNKVSGFSFSESSRKSISNSSLPPIGEATKPDSPTSHATTAVVAGQSQGGTNPSQPISLSDWALYEDPASGQVFWYNAVTQISQWECPFEQDYSEVASKSNRSNLDDSSENAAAITVQHEDDLGI